MPLLDTTGNNTEDAYQGGIAVVPNYIEDVFSTYLYTGTSPTNQTINNGIDLSTKGGMVWFKGRNASAGSSSNVVIDTVRGRASTIKTSATNGEAIDPAGYDVVSFNSNGFTVAEPYSVILNNSSIPINYVSWTFRKQPKFFDVLTWTGTGSNTTISHSLGSVPACIMVKRTDTSGDWQVYHSSLANTQYMVLNTTAAVATGATRWNSTTPTSSVFSVGTDATVNASGGTYVAYLFASNAGGFGLTGTDNVITCGSYTGTGAAGNAINLGYEAQWVLIKDTTSAYDWAITDTMRGMSVTDSPYLRPNLSSAEADPGSPIVYANATGFTLGTGSAGWNKSGDTYIYIAIRRGPMKVPTDATTVFIPLLKNNATGTENTTGFPVDFQISRNNTGADITYVFDRLRGVSTTPALVISPMLDTTSTAAEDTTSYSTYNWNNTAFGTSNSAASLSEIYWNFQRAPSFFDEVCYTGTGSATTFSHNLGAVPELMIVKCRNSASPEWTIYNQTLGNGQYLFFNTTAAGTYNMWNATSPTSSVFSVSSYSYVNGSGNTYVAYLFATCAGVSKVGSYTGNGGTQAIACGFTGGARFVLIKCTSTTGAWYTYDTARGMTTLTDPYLRINQTAAESATLGSVTTTTGGFTVNASILSAINTNAASYIFFAVA